MNMITIGGKARPFHVGTNQGDIFCRLQGLSLAQYAATFSDIGGLGLGAQRDFLYSALRAGAEKAGEQVTFSATEVGYWMDEPDYSTAEALAPVVSALAAQFAAKEAYQKERNEKKALPLPSTPDATAMAVAV